MIILRFYDTYVRDPHDISKKNNKVSGEKGKKWIESREVASLLIDFRSSFLSFFICSTYLGPPLPFVRISFSLSTLDESFLSVNRNRIAYTGQSLFSSSYLFETHRIVLSLLVRNCQCQICIMLTWWWIKLFPTLLFIRYGHNHNH